MGRLRSLALAFSTVAAATAVFGAAGYFGGHLFIDRQNRSQLHQLNQFVLGRAELEVDFAFIALGDLVEVGAAGCDPAALVQMRRQVYLRSTVKDIRVIDSAGRSRCAAFPEMLELDTVVNPADASPARNSRIRLFRIAHHAASALGVLWQIIPDFSLVAVLNTDALLFDVLPPELQGKSAVRLTLPTGEIVAEFSPRRSSQAPLGDTIAFQAQSERYPLATQLNVDAAALGAWNKGLEIQILAGAAALGLAFGVLLARLIVRRKTFLSEIDDALAAGEFRPFAQPVFSLSTGAITGCEILARWVRPDGIEVSPYRFIELAEETGRIRPLTQALMREALADLQQLLHSDGNFTVAFNISPKHFLSDGFVEEVCDLVARSNVAPGQIVFEITERQQVVDLATGAGLIKRLADREMRVAIDDAGTGHNGLSYLQRLGAQIMKIDKFFVDAIEFDYSARVLVEMLVRVAHQLGMTTIAEGIERPEQASWLSEIGVDQGQGFLVSPALPIPDFLSLVTARAAEADRSQTADRLVQVA